MALDSYANLKLSIINWSHRSDMDLLIDDFILLAETEMFANRVEPLQIRTLEVTSNADVSTQLFAFPDRFQSMRSMKIVDDQESDVLFKTPDALVRRSGTGRPKYFTATNQLEFDVAPDATYAIEMSYFAKPLGLSSSNTTNVILADFPNIYLYGVLAQLFKHTQDTENEASYKNEFLQAIQGANQADEDGRYGPAPYARIDGPTP